MFFFNEELNIKQIDLIEDKNKSTHIKVNPDFINDLGHFKPEYINYGLLTYYYSLLIGIMIHFCPFIQDKHIEDNFKYLFNISFKKQTI